MQVSLPYIETKNFEPFGTTFAQLCIEKFSKNFEDENQVKNDKNTFHNTKNSSTNIKTSQNSKKKLNKQADFEINIQQVKNAKLDDYYSLLGLADLDVYATSDQIKKAYRKVSLQFHPDKCSHSSNGDDISSKYIHQRFKAIVEAYEVLSDPLKRRLYDSSKPFDESIPSESEFDFDDIETHQTSNFKTQFYSLYEPVFKRNSKFSITQPVPQLGNEESSDNHVNAFYNFWFNFKSQRDFTYLGQQSIEHAQSREEKRQMIKENKAVAQKASQEEKRRIMKLVEQAHNLDPRIKRIEKRLEQEKLNRKRLKVERKRKEAEERLKNEEELKKRQEETKLELQKKVEKERKEKMEKQERLKFLISEFKNLCYENILSKFSSIFNQRQQAKIKDACNRISIFYGSNINYIKQLTTLISELSNLIQDVNTDFKKFEIIEPVSINKTKNVDLSTDSEKNKPQIFEQFWPFFNQILTQINREKKMAHDSNVIGAEKFDGDDKANYYKNKKLSSKSTNDEQSHQELSRLAKAFSKYPSGTPKRQTQIRQFMGTNRSVKELISKCKQMNEGRSSQKILQNDAFSVYKNDLSTKIGTKSNKIEVKQPKAEEKVIQNNEVSDTQTIDQQNALEKGLKLISTFPQDQKQDKIAEMVPNKSKRDCMLRFKRIRAEILAKKQAQSQ